MRSCQPQLAAAGRPAVLVTTPSMSKMTAANPGSAALGACWRAPRCGSLLGRCGGVTGRVGVEGGSAVRRAEVVGHTVDFAASGSRLGVDGHTADRVDGRGC